MANVPVSSSTRDSDLWVDEISDFIIEKLKAAKAQDTAALLGKSMDTVEAMLLLLGGQFEGHFLPSYGTIERHRRFML